jgi:hypothetical protein
MHGTRGRGLDRVRAIGSVVDRVTVRLLERGRDGDFNIRDAFMPQAGEQLHARFGGGHLTLQTVRLPLTKGCAETVEPASDAAH